MSNLDTTLREKFYKWYSDQWVANEGVYPDRTEIADFFIGHFHQLLNEKREAIEALKTTDLVTDDPASTYAVNSTLDDVLSILKD